MKILSVMINDVNNIETYIEKGADEIIMPLKDASFHVYGFKEEEILACAKKYDCINVLMNRLFHACEIDEVKRILTVLVPKVNAVYFADPALLQIAKEMNVTDKMIFRPETLMTNSMDAEWWMSHGLKSVQISPLLTADEIEVIAGHVPHCSLVIHGYQPMSISKRKLVSAYAQASGWNSHVKENTHLTLKEETREHRMPVYENDHAAMIYTDFVQLSSDYINRFVKAGVERFEIEHAFIEEDHFVNAIALYRALLDGKNADVRTFLETYEDIPFASGYYEEKTVK